VQEGLREVYGSVDEIELYPGLFAEDTRPNAVLPSLIGRMVAIDAFSQAFTNPLLAPRVFNEQTFSPVGWELIRTTRTLSDLLHRNIPDASRGYHVTMTRPDWVRS
jgi:prostaglandin-endoperoxide synthase 2